MKFNNLIMTGLIWAGSDPKTLTRDVVGGKGFNLLRLYQFAQQTGLFEVPNFFIVPVGTERKPDEGLTFDFKYAEQAYNKLTNPVIARSSSPLEDGVKASFAGMFRSIPDLNNYKSLTVALYDIIESAWLIEVANYAEKMEVDITEDMAIIVQEQVTNALEKGVIQLEENKAVTEAIDSNGRSSHNETEYAFLDEFLPKGFKLEIKPGDKPRGWLSEGESHHAVYCARKAKEGLGLDGVVQVEFLLAPQQLPKFVQIRQLPKVKPYAYQLDMQIPDDVPYIESEICNGIAGETVLPAYVTTSKSGLRTLLVHVGHADIIGAGDRIDERADDFLQNSKLAQNPDYQTFCSALGYEMMTDESVMHYFNDQWKRGNDLFDEYVLVCDRLDETFAGMANLTKNKKAIITCNDAMQTSHAMTVARDLGIPAMGVEGDMRDINHFFYQVETGDTVHMKSDGKKAVAYIQKKRTSNPYKK
ncbi:hypothetical protein CEE44_05255 [Candidatus Woesearchaeota archaeon B3_Woes]|nr:MAG: hypothetical protein CEE44_05255 [Candidatus Woesearchaeota archaeon B3_Woes]